MLKKGSFRELVITAFDDEVTREWKLNMALGELKTAEARLKDSKEQLKTVINEIDNNTKEFIIEILDEINDYSFVSSKVKVKNNKLN